MDENKSSKQSINETYKRESNFLRGHIKENLVDPLTLAVDVDTKELMKFHGIYMQDDRDVRDERKRKKLEPAYSFMIRVPFAGGDCSSKQWLMLDHLANTIANKTLRITTRQAVQYHGVLRTDLPTLMQGFDKVGLCSMNGCGDVSRNVMGTTLYDLSPIHQQVHQCVNEIHQTLEAKTNAWREIWLNEKPKEFEPGHNEEPLYGDVYLPRKFKIGVVVQPSNDIDVYSQDIGLIAITENDKLLGYNVLVGGGMGSTRGNKDTYPQLARLIGFCHADDVIEVCKTIVTIQRDFGDRENRKQSRMKYTIDSRGIEWFKQELNSRLGFSLEQEKPFELTGTGDLFGWHQNVEGLWHFGMFIENGRVKDTEEYLLMTALREIATVHEAGYRFTPNQNLVIKNIKPEDKEAVEILIEKYQLGKVESPTRKLSMACVSMPTCPLGMAEAERYFPEFIDKIDDLMTQKGLQDEEIKFRMSGCPNGCSRPYMAEVAFVGRAPGKYDMYLGGDYVGKRLAGLYRENMNEEAILTELDKLITHYANDRNNSEYFGDFVIRQGYAEEITDGRNFHK